MHSGTALHLRRSLVWPAGWLAFLTTLAGAAATALTIITLASEHFVEAAVAGGCAIGLFAIAIMSFKSMSHIADAHTREIEARRDHAVYRARYPL
ncbi:hypothetical protein [Gordonia rubripertincta]|uniref:Uncharacterized protein n=1 Tax=Gordonia rubripertincta TaxID=36822 RepID=A0ABT4MSR4_GORRU|nr:hypothetical protein [Gordonia rubripertincta]MCZ4550050.1 hypothetical protein [Gordonia rubripertincta]